jgi:3'-5' exoribonuclease
MHEFPELLKDKLFHLILSHQGELEFGSPIRPQMLEALVLSFVDNNSAFMNQAVKHIEKNLPSGEDFTDYHKWLGRSLWQKDFLP